MSRVVTVEAPANIAFIKYWGAVDLERAIPVNPSISMTLDRCVSRTTVRCLGPSAPDRVELIGEDGASVPVGGSFRARIVAHLDRLRAEAGVATGLEVRTRNSFPAAAGMASSASGFAALTVATTRALGQDPDVAELSRLARLSGSGSAARSVLGGYVEWPAEGSESAHAVQLADADHWDLRDVVALVQTGPKRISSLEGHRRAATSPHYARRQELLPERLARVRRAIRARDLEALGPVLEADAVELHLVAMSSSPAIFYWAPATLRVLERLRTLREQGVRAWATMDAGPNVHVICAPESEGPMAAALAAIEGVERVIRDRVGSGPRLLEDHFDSAPEATS